MIAKTGVTYLHKKGTLYTVVGFATHTETREEMVIYAVAEGEAGDCKKLYARPRAMFEDGRFKEVTA